MTLTPKSKRELQRERTGEESAQDRIWKAIEPLLIQLHERMLTGITYRKSGKNGRQLQDDPNKIDMSKLPGQFLVSLVLRAIGEIDDHGSFQKLAKELQKPLSQKAAGDSVDVANKALAAARKEWGKAGVSKTGENA